MSNHAGFSRSKKMMEMAAVTRRAKLQSDHRHRSTNTRARATRSIARLLLWQRVRHMPVTGRGACHSDGLFGHKTLNNGSARTSCRYFPSLGTIGRSRYRSIVRREAKYRQCTICETILKFTKSVCRPVLTEAVLGVQ